MRKRRIGTFSMAIVLIVFGVILIVAQINKVSALNLSIKFWPIILFLLGGEILWISYKYKEDDVKIKYDVFSIFMILIIVLVSVGIYGLMETNILSRVNERITSENFRFKIPCDELKIDDKVEKIVIDAPSNCKLSVRSENSDKIIFSGMLDIQTNNEEKAKKLANNNYIITHESNNILYVSFNQPSFHDRWTYSIQPFNFKLIIPNNKKIEISEGQNLDLVLNNIKNDWVIDSMYSTKIRLERNLDAKINAFVNDEDNLRGNVSWNVINNSTKVEEENEQSSDIKGELTYGKGSNNIYILNSDEVIIDELK